MARVLVVEDDAETRDQITSGLAAAGHQVVAAADGQEGLLHALLIDFDVIVTADMLPLMHGDEMLGRLFAAGEPRPPTLIVSSKSAEELRVKFPYGAVLLHKPFDTDRLVRHVRALAARR